MNIPLRLYVSLLAKYLRPHWRSVTVLALLLALNTGLQLINPQILRLFIDGARGMDTRQMLLIALAFAGTAIAGNIAAGLATYLSERVAWGATNALRSDLMKHTLALDMGFHKRHTAGEMIERIDGDVTAMSNFFSQFVVRVVGTMALMIGILGLLFREDWRIGLVMTGYALLTLLVLRRTQGIAVPHFKAQRQASADLSAFWEERLSGLEDIRSSGAVAHTLRQQFAFLRALFKKSERAAMLGRILFAAIIMMFAVGNASAIAVGGQLLGMGLITLGTVYLIFDYTGTLSSNLRVITEQLDDLQRAGAGIERTAELIQTISALPDEAAPQPVAAGAPALVFEHVSFAYNDGTGITGGAAPDTPVIQDVTFTLQPGRVLGLLGRTGSGKSTLTRLLFRFYDPTSGAITLDGAALSAMPLDQLRGQIGLVTQEVQLFQATVRDNLTFFDATISDDAILRALGTLGLQDWLDKLPRGLDSELDAGSGGLSAGEAQLLAFVRVFLRDPRLVVLDEASSRLDPVTEQRIERAVETLLKGRTAIIIAHHLGTVQRVDDILILEDGLVREHGDRAVLRADPESRFSQLLRAGVEAVLA